MERSVWFSLGAASILAFSIWALSPTLIGHAEPWDSDWPFYSLAAAGTGAVLGLAFPWRVASTYLGAWFGQLVALAVLPGIDRSWFLLGVFSTAVGSLFFAGGALVGGTIGLIAGGGSGKKGRRRVAGGDDLYSDLRTDHAAGPGPADVVPPWTTLLGVAIGRP